MGPGFRRNSEKEADIEITALLVDPNWITPSSAGPATSGAGLINKTSGSGH
jgi:hypothetical protein